MGLKLILILFIFYFLSTIFNLTTWFAIFCYLITMFGFLPLIYYVNKTNHSTFETRNYFKHQSYLLTPSIKKRGFFKTLSKVSNVDVTESDTQFTSISPYPSRRVEEVIDDLIYEIIKYYVLPYAEANNWKFVNTEAFLKKFLKKFASEIVHRMSVIDWNNFFCNSICEHLRSHINFLKSRNNQNEENNYFMGSKTEILFTEAVANRLLRSLLDQKYIQCEVIYQFCLGLLAHQVIVKTVEYYCDPTNQNKWMFKTLIERKITRSKMNKQMPHFQYDMSFENFFKLVGSINDVNEVKQIKDKLQNEVRMVEVLKFTQMDNDSKKSSKSQGVSKSKGNTKYFKGQLLTKRDLKCYYNQLNTLLETVNTKLKMMGNSTESINIKLHSSTGSKRAKLPHRAVKNTEKQTLSKKFKLKVTQNFKKGKSLKNNSERASIISECIPYETVMNSNEGRKFFKEFLNITNCSRTVELIEMLIKLQENTSDQHVIAQTLVKRYIHSSPPAFEFDKQLIKEMEEFLKGNASEKVFEKAKILCDKELKKSWYPYFILSPNYHKFTKQIAKELSVIDQMKLKGICPTTMSSETETTDNDSDNGSDESPANRDEKIMSDTEMDEENNGLLFNFTESLQANNPNDDASGISLASHSNQSGAGKEVTSNFDEQYDEEYDEEEEDGFLKPKFEEIIQPIGGNETLEYYQSKISKLNKKIDVKQKAYDAGIAVSTQMPLNRTEKSKMKLDLKAVHEDLDRLFTKRNKYLYNLSRMNRWIVSVGKWSAFVYDIVLPEPKRGTSLDLGFLTTLSESKAGNTDRDESFTEDETKEILIFIMVTLGMTEEHESTGEDNGWLVRHTLKDFQSLKRELTSLSPSVDRISLPKVPQRLFVRRKYTDNDLSRITKGLDAFIKFVMNDPLLAQSEIVFKFFCSSLENGQLIEEENVTGPLTSLANTFSDASAKVKLMAKIPSKFVQKVLAQKKRSGSITSFDSDDSECKPDKKNSLRRSSGYGNLSGSLRHRFRKNYSTKDFSMSAFELLEELIQLRKSLTLTRRSMITFVQSFFGKNLTQILTENVAYIKAESTIFHSLQTYRDSFRTESCLSTQNSFELSLKQQQPPAAVDSVQNNNTASVHPSSSSSCLAPVSRMHPSASAFITVTDCDQPADPKLHKVSSNSSPTMSKARSYSKSSAAVSCEALLSQSVSMTGGTDVRTGTMLSTAVGGYDPSWTYSIKCDEAVKRLVWESVPEYLKTLFGTMSVADSVGFVYESMQNMAANKALVYRMLQSFVDQLLEEDGGSR